jgi:hypothetical protein
MTVMKHLATVFLPVALLEWAGRQSSRRRTALRLATLMLSFAVTSVAGQLFQESFSGAVPGGRYSLGPIPGTQFTVIAGNVNVVACADRPSGNCLDLTGSVGVDVISSVPAFNLTAGTIYTIMFGVTAQGGATNINFSVGLGTFMQPVAATPSPQQITVQFLTPASQSGVHLTFTSITNPGDSVNGPVLENIVLSGNASNAMVLPQFVSGAGWDSTLYFTNTNAVPVSVAVNFIGDDGNRLSLPVGASTFVNLAAHGTGGIVTPSLGPLIQGYASVTLPAGVLGYGLFHRYDSGGQTAVPLSAASTTTSTLAWDDTVSDTAVAIVNPSDVATTVSILLRDESGATIGTSSVFLPARNKTAVVMHSLPGFSTMTGNRGSADFTVASGNVAVLGLRFTIGSTFTFIPTADR